MFKFVALLALFALLAFAQEPVTPSTFQFNRTGDLGGDFNWTREDQWNGTFSTEPKPLPVFESNTEFSHDSDREFDDDRFELNITKDQNETIRQRVLSSPEVQALQALELATVIQLKIQRDTIKATLELNQKALDAFKQLAEQNATELLGEWKDRLENLTHIRNESVDHNKTIGDRIDAFVQFQVEKFVAKQVAARAFKLAADGEVKEFALRVANATLFLLNNTIAKKNNSNVDGASWTPLDTAVLKSKLIDLLVASKIAEFKAENKTRELFQNITAERDDAIDELKAVAQKIRSGVKAKVDDIKADWKAKRDQNVTIAERIKDFVENVTGVAVDLSGLDGLKENITAKITVALDQAAAQNLTVAEVKKLLEEHIKAVFIALTGADDSNVTVTATTATKRAVSTYAVTTQVGEQSAESATASASTIVASALAALAAICLAVF